MKFKNIIHIKIIITALKIIFISAVIIFFDVRLCKPQSDTIFKKKEWIIKSFFDTQIQIFSSPLSIKSKDLQYLIPLVSTTIITLIYDEEINSKIRKFRSETPVVDKLSPILTKGGELPFIVGTSGIIYITGLVSKDEKLKQTGAIASYALVNSAVVITLLKMTFGRQRPNYDGNSNWHFFPQSLNQFEGEELSKYNSFPSGHSIAAWSLATVIAEQYKNNMFIPIIAYTFATGVSLSRITENAHWLSDVIIGSALGYGIGKFVTKSHKNTSWFLIPSQNGGKLSITGIYMF